MLELCDSFIQSKLNMDMDLFDLIHILKRKIEQKIPLLQRNFFIFIYLYNFTNGLIVGILTAFVIFVITILLDGFAEIIQLLENIKNK